MKRIALLLFLTIAAIPAFAQDSINPYNTQLPNTIELHYTNVYYNPFAPPGDSDTRINLCNQSDQLRDPNGIGDNYRTYFPIVYDSTHHKFDSLKDWAPHGTPIGPNTPWQRFFTAKRDSHGNAHDIIAGGLPGDSVVISRNEDVDFRASGRIILKSGFRTKAGAVFHAYTEPKWDTTVFSDEFNDTAKYRNQWHIGKGWGDINNGAECSFDSNAYIDTDYQAEDGYALDIVMREPPGDTCSCTHAAYNVNQTDTCNGDRLDNTDTTPRIFAFSSATPRSCPYPYTTTSGTLGGPTYAHAPYGKYEFRDKIPHTLHHTNNWGGSWDNEFDLDETDNATMGRVNPNWNHHFKYGPYMGIFKITGTDTFFISHTAGWGRHTVPTAIIIDNFLYRVSLYNNDTAVATAQTHDGGGFPSSVVTRTDSIPFYYEDEALHYADTVTWTVDSTGTKFKAAWDTAGGISTLFSKGYQPVTLTLTIDTGFITGTIKKTFNCHWDHTLNSGSDTGWLRLDDTMPPTALHANTEAYQFVIGDMGVGGGHERYPVPTVQIDNDTGNPPTPGDIAQYDSSAYRYHTFTMEWLPHEIRYLIDSNVVYRFPDRLVPRSSPYYDWVSTEPRSPTILFPAEFDIDPLTNSQTDPFGTNDTIQYIDGFGDTSYVSLTYFERKFFESHLTNPGFWPVNGQPAAHHMLDYVKIWDVPKDVIIPSFPH